MVGLRFNSHLSFFDPAAVLDPIQREQRGVLSGAGAFVRRDAKGLIRPAKKPSQPGKPPHSHTGELREDIFFAYDSAEERVLIGPEKLNQVFFDGDGKPLSGTVPEILEQPEGGDIQILEVFNEHSQKWHRADLRSKRRLAGRKTRLRKVHVRGRPFMAPALNKNVDKFPGLWADVITD